MIIGTVNAKLEASISLHVENINGQPMPIAAGIDTGFSGYLALRPAVIAGLGIPLLGKRVFILGNGTTFNVDVYSGVVIWDGQARIVEIHAVDTEPLVGMKMLAGHELRIVVVNGGSVWIDAAP